MKLLIDADVPTSLGLTLRRQGHDVVDVRQLPHAPLDDQTIEGLARREGRILITRDVGLSSPLQHHPIEETPGRIIIRMHRVSPATVVQAVTGLLETISERDLTGRLAVIQPGRLRLRPPKSP